MLWVRYRYVTSKCPCERISLETRRSIAAACVFSEKRPPTDEPRVNVRRALRLRPPQRPSLSQQCERTIPPPTGGHRGKENDGEDQTHSGHGDSGGARRSTTGRGGCRAGDGRRIQEPWQPFEARPPDFRRRTAPEGPRLVCLDPSGLGARLARRPRHQLHAGADPGAVRLVPGPRRPGDRRQPRHDGRLLRRHVQPGAAPRRHDRLLDRETRRRSRLHRGRRHRHQRARRRPGSRGSPGQHPLDDRQAGQPAQPRRASGGPEDLQAGVSAPVHQGEHRVRGREERRPDDRMVRQAPRLRDPQRPVGQGRRRPLHPGDQQPVVRAVHR